MPPERRDVRKAKKLGMRPRALIGNIPNSSQQWKAPVRFWIRDLYAKRFGEPSLSETEGGGAGTGRRKLVTSVESNEDGWGPGDREASDWEMGDSVPYDPQPSLREDEAETNQSLLRSREQLRAAADYVAAAFAELDFVEKVALFGSVAAPLRKELPRFSRLRRAGIAVWHECGDVDLAVWLADFGSLRALGKARGRALNELREDSGAGVAHHQVDVHLMDAARSYRGNLCDFGSCPKDGKIECLVPGCGAARFLRLFAGFHLDPSALGSEHVVTIFDRASATGPPRLDRWWGKFKPAPDDLPF